jgi:hypothetical protein
MQIDLQYNNINISKKLNILHIAIACILLLYALDCVYFVFKFSLGYGFPVSEYGDPNDIFADLFKIAFAIKGFSGDFLKSEAFSHFNNIYKIFAAHDVYKTMEEWTPGYHTIDWMPPVLLLAPAVTAFFLKIGAPTQFILFIYISVLYLLALYVLYFCCSLGKVKFPFLLSLIVIIVAMPTIIAIIRGNFNAAYTCIGIIAFSITISLKNEFRFLPSFLLAMSIGARPTAIIFLALPVLLYGINRKTISIIIYTSILSVTVTVLCWLFLKYIANHNWNIPDFLSALKVHNDIYISKGLGNTHNLSLRGLIFVIFQNSTPGVRTYIFYICCLFLTSIIFAVTMIRKYNTDIYIFLLCSFYALCNGSFFIYHNLIFLAPLYLYYIKREQNNIKNSFDLKLTAFISIVLLSPNSFLFNSPVAFDRFLLLFSIVIFTIRSLFYKTKEYNIQEIIFRNLRKIMIKN